MKTFAFDTTQLRTYAPHLKAGDRVLLSGVIFTARDAAHKQFFALLDRGAPLPFDICDATIYYAGPTAAVQNLAVGACGPTTSNRMDIYTPRLMDLGLCCTIGKGERARPVVDAIIRNKGVYLCAIGGAGATACNAIKRCEVIAFPQLGCESVKRLEIESFPLIVAIDANGGNIFEAGKQAYRCV